MCRQVVDVGPAYVRHIHAQQTHAHENTHTPPAETNTRTYRRKKRAHTHTYTRSVKWNVCTLSYGTLYTRTNSDIYIYIYLVGRRTKSGWCVRMSVVTMLLLFHENTHGIYDGDDGGDGRILPARYARRTNARNTGETATTIPQCTTYTRTHELGRFIYYRIYVCACVGVRGWLLYVSVCVYAYACVLWICFV